MQLSFITAEQQSFRTKFPKHIIVLNSKNQHCNLLVLKRMIDTKPSIYGDLFKFSAEFATTMSEVKKLVKTIKMQQHQLEIEKVIQMKNNSQSLPIVNDGNADMKGNDAVAESKSKHKKESGNLYKSLVIHDLFVYLFQYVF